MFCFWTQCIQNNTFEWLEILGFRFCFHKENPIQRTLLEGICICNMFIIVICSKMFFRKCQRPGCRNSCNNVRSSVKNFCTPACATAHQMSTSTVVVVQQQIPSSNKKQKAETTVAEIATAPPSTSQGYLNFSGLVWIADAYHKIASSRLSRFVAHSWIFRLYEVEIWCLCTVTFGQKSLKLNSRPFYCSQLYITSNQTNKMKWTNTYILELRVRVEWIYSNSKVIGIEKKQT